jgi:hypothetical protein
MKSTCLILVTLATSIQARSLVLGDFEIIEPFSGGFDTQPGVWLNAGDGVSPDSGIVNVGSATGQGGNGRLCDGQSCPLKFSFNLCSGTVDSADGNSARVSVSGPGYNIPGLYCGKDTGYSKGDVTKDGRIQSWYRCDLGSAQC